MLDQATLSTELAGIALSNNVEDAAEAWADAFGNYMKEGESNGVGIVDAPVDSTAKPNMSSLMEAGLPGVTTIPAFCSLLVVSLNAFWAAMVAAPGAFLPGSTVIAPPTSYTGLAAALEPVLEDNLANALSQADAMDAIATVIHNFTTQQPVGAGTATFTTPVFPIL